jgi:hypothetical protein
MAGFGELGLARSQRIGAAGAVVRQFALKFRPEPKEIRWKKALLERVSD